MVLEGESSEELSVTSGVPQGSVLEHILFLLYINDLPDDIKSQVRLFAVDTAVYLTLDKQNSPQQLQDDHDQLQKWEIMWDMEFNLSKCVAMHIIRAKRPINSQYLMHNQILDTVDTPRYIGVDISSNLNFKQHINRITSNANRTFGFLKRNIRVKNPCVREAAYQTLLRPQVKYASTIWNPYTK